MGNTSSEEIVEIRKVIIFDISGGLGNQFFQYAFGRHLAQKNNTNLKINVSSFERDKQRTFKLDCFNTKYEIIPLEQILAYLKSYLRLPPLFRKWYRKYWPVALSRYFESTGFDSYNPRFKKAQQGYFYGYWSNEKYFKETREQLLKEFMLREELITPALRAAKEKFKRENTVAVHVRRGDYVHHPVYQNIFNQLSMSYYEKAVNLLEQRIVTPEFYVFTDDIAWSRKNFGTLSSDISFVDEFKLKHDYEEFELMRTCRHFINANSTFSWWAAWLAADEEKMVIAPKKWYKDDRLNTNDFIPESWILL